MSQKEIDTLISAIYSGTLSPETFGATFDALDTVLFPGGQSVSADDSLMFANALFLGQGADRSLDPTILQHIEMARNIQSRVGRKKPQGRVYADLLESNPNPSYLLEPSGAVIGLNSMASARHDFPPGKLEDCVVDEHTRELILNFFTDKSGGNVLSVAGFLDLKKSNQTSFVVKRIDAALVPGRETGVFLLTIVDFGFDSGTQGLFKETYRLTQAEAQVAVLLAGGMRLQEIAVKRKVSLDTLRTQVKWIKAKTGTADIPALVRLLCGFSAGILAPTGASPAISVGYRDLVGDGRRHFVGLRDGRRLEYRDEGATEGAAVLLLHNVPYGADLPSGSIELARDRNLRFLSPYRPGYADSDNIEDVDGDRVFDEVARDYLELLDELQIEKAVLVSNGISAAYALRFATLFPERVQGLIALSRVPMWDDEWLQHPPRRRRFLLRLAKYAPQLLPVVAWTMIACLEQGYAREYVTQWIEEDSTEAAASRDPEILNLLIRGTLDAMRRGTEGFCRECALSMVDMREEAKASSHKFHILCGAGDDIVAPPQLERFAAEVPGTTLEVIPRAGHLLFYTHGREILDVIALKSQ